MGLIKANYKGAITMSTFVLIHGGMHGAWCWYKVVTLLQAMGHNVIAPDLPGHGIDKTPTAKVTLADYVNRVCQILDDQSDPVVLVGHSMGGLTITGVAEARPNKIKKLIYIAALLPGNGEYCGQLMQPDGVNSTMEETILSEDQMSTTLPEDRLNDIFYGDCSDADIALARLLLVPQAVEPVMAPVYHSEKNFGQVPRTYITCLKDNTLSPDAQKHMYEKTACQKVIAMNTSHSPFFSAPEELVQHMVSLAVI